jgi:hypothetical protein
MGRTRRSTIPRVKEEETLFNANHICCICRDKNKDVVIHHIDSNNSNNELDNLAVVCLDCHSRVTGRKRGLGKAYKPGEVRRYKRAWDKQIRDSRNVHRPQIYYKKELISQIDLIVCEIICSKNASRQEELLEVLFELHLWRGSKEIDSKILEGLNHLALMGGLNSSRLTQLVAEKVWEMAFQFVGPKEVPMGKSDVAYILKCLDILECLADFGCGYSRGKKATETVAKKAENFFELALWYSKKKIAKAVLMVYRSGLGSCVFQGKNEFPSGTIVLKRSLRRILQLLRDEKAKWKEIDRSITTILKTYKDI